MNIQKIRDRFNGHQDDSRTVQRLVRNEHENGIGYSGSAAEALLWLTRSLDFTAQALRKDLNDNRDVPPDSNNPRLPLSDAFRDVYPNTLAQYHNGVQQSLFGAAWMSVPRRRDFYRRLAADDSTQAAVEDGEVGVGTGGARAHLERLHEFR
jgi:hypothetical protein